jgi:glycosyltransferase involved in cell wall biosynthesis
VRIVYHHRTGAQDGSAVHIESLIGELRALGVTVDLVAPAAAAPAVGARSKAPWLAALRRRLPRVLHELAELAYNVPEFLRLWRVVRATRPAAIYERSNTFLLSGVWVAKLTGTMLVTEVNAPYFLERSKHGGLVLTGLARWSETFAWRRSDAVIAVTRALGRIVRDHGVPAGRIHVMPNGVDPRHFSPAGIDPGAKAALGLQGRTVLGFTGFVRDWNGLDQVIELLATPDGAAMTLLVVGDGPARAGLERLARERGVGDRVTFTGVVVRERIPFHVSAFDIALQPAANPYASPLKLFEYLALRRPVVAPDQPNIREVLEDGRNARLFAPADAASFRAAIVDLTRDAALRDRIAAGAGATIGALGLTWKHNAGRVKDLVESRRGGDSVEELVSSPPRASGPERRYNAE